MTPDSAPPAAAPPPAAQSAPAPEAAFSAPEMPAPNAPGAALDLGGVEIEVSVELGRRRLPIGELSALGVGSVLELDTLAGEPIGVFANGQRIAAGEVVVVDGQLGVRIVTLEGHSA